MKSSFFLFASLVLGSSAVNAASAPVTDITKSSTSLDARLERLERLLHTRNQAQIQIQQQLDQLQDEVNEIRGVTEVHSHKLEQLNERQRELYQELESRFSAKSAATNSPATSAAGGVAVNGDAYSGSYSENEAYDKAVNLVLKDRRYDQAIPEFRAFIKRYPDSGYAANAHYWLGQLMFNKGLYTEAQAEFDVVVNKFPDSPKRSDALLKLGTVAQKTNNVARAKQLFEQVISEYPDTSSARLAETRLQSIK